ADHHVDLWLPFAVPGHPDKRDEDRAADNRDKRDIDPGPGPPRHRHPGGGRIGARGPGSPQLVQRITAEQRDPRGEQRTRHQSPRQPAAWQLPHGEHARQTQPVPPADFHHLMLIDAARAPDNRPWAEDWRAGGTPASPRVWGALAPGLYPGPGHRGDRRDRGDQADEGAEAPADVDHAVAAGLEDHRDG